MWYYIVVSERENINKSEDQKPETRELAESAAVDETQQHDTTQRVVPQAGRKRLTEVEGSEDRTIAQALEEAGGQGR